MLTGTAVLFSLTSVNPGSLHVTSHKQDISTKPADPALPIKQLLLARKLSVTGLARTLRRSRQAVSIAIHHPERYPRLRAEIEGALA